MKTLTQTDSKVSPKDRWRTPNNDEQPIIKLVQNVFGRIDLDPTADDNKSVPALNHFTEQDNCLIRTWAGNSTIYMNPPFSNPLPFIEKLVAEYGKGHIQEAIGLFKVGVLSNKGTGKVIKKSFSAVCLWGGNVRRIGFVDATGNIQHGADFDCCIVYWGQNVKKFCHVFAPYGSTVVPFL